MADKKINFLFRIFSQKLEANEARKLGYGLRKGRFFGIIVRFKKMNPKPKKIQPIIEEQKNEYSMPSPFESDDLNKRNETEPLKGAEDIVQDNFIIDIREKIKGNIRRLNDAKKMAITDGLTELFNRRGYDTLIEFDVNRAKRNHKSLSVIMVDIDHFKLVNDLNDHAWGDEKIRQIASILKSSVRKGDYAARIGGEEFVLVLHETDIQGAVAVAEKIRKSVEEIAIADKKVQDEKDFKSGMAPQDQLIGTISLGCSELTKEINDPVKLLASADRALYESKHTGRNKVTAQPDNQNRIPKAKITMP